LTHFSPPGIKLIQIDFGFSLSRLGAVNELEVGLTGYPPNLFTLYCELIVNKCQQQKEKPPEGG